MKLKPCPFCGGGTLEITYAVGEYWVRCFKCNASSEARSGEESAIKMWNTRTPAVDKEKLIKRLVNDLDVEFFEDILEEINSGDFDL